MGQPYAAPPGSVAALAHLCQCPFTYIISPKTKDWERGSQKDSAASSGRKTHTERKLSGRQKSAREIPSRRGEIVAIVTVIELGFIGIIITTTIATTTFITIITTLSRCNILG
jgi:hypothetical protein